MILDPAKTLVWIGCAVEIDDGGTVGNSFLAVHLVRDKAPLEFILQNDRLGHHHLDPVLISPLKFKAPEFIPLGEDLGTPACRPGHDC